MKWPVACLSTDGGRAGCTNLYYCPHASVCSRTHTCTQSDHICMDAYVNTAPTLTHPHKGRSAKYRAHLTAQEVTADEQDCCLKICYTCFTKRTQNSKHTSFSEIKTVLFFILTVT